MDGEGIGVMGGAETQVPGENPFIDELFTQAFRRVH
jgi:hypothetical protein